MNRNRNHVSGQRNWKHRSIGVGNEAVSDQPKLLDALRCRHYSRHTEKTYRQWVFPHENLWVSAKTGEQERHYVDDSIVQRARIYAFTILLVSALILSGCATGRTGTHVEPNLEDISAIKKVGLCVKVEKGFAVRLQYVSNADQVFLANLIGISLAAHQGARLGGASADTAVGIGTGIGAVGAVIGEFSPDKRATRALKPEAAQINSAEAIGYALMDKLKAAKVFPEIEIVPYEKLASAGEHGTDTLFIITVRRWGLRPPLGSKYTSGDKAEAQLELDVNLKLISSTTGKILWERDEFYPDRECYSLGDFKSKEGLLADRMEHALQSVCDLTAKEIYRTR